MTRAEFSRKIKRAALERSGGYCEAVGPWYGLHEGERCGFVLYNRQQFDHVILEANSHDNSLENCLAICPACHRFKTSRRDIPLAAKTQRQFDKHHGIKGRKYKWPKRRFARS